MSHFPRLFSALMLLAILAGAIQAPLALTAPAAPGPTFAPRVSRPSDIPAPTNGARPTIMISPDHGYAGQEVVVSGEGVPPSQGVRISWLTGEATRTAAVVPLGPSNSYSATIVVPHDAAAGPAQVCATVTDTEQAEFACVDFTIETPPPGAVQGALPLTTNRGMNAQAGPEAINATFNLLNGIGDIVASTPISTDGRFAVEDVPPGSYQTAIIGSVPVMVDLPEIIVKPGLTSEIDVRRVVCSGAAQVATVRADRDGHTGPNDFGTYVSLGASGSVVNVTFEAALQVSETATIDAVEFTINPAGHAANIVMTATVASEPNRYRATYNVSLLPPGTSYLTVTPIVGGLRACASPRRSIHVIRDPMSDALIQPTTGRTTWNGSAYAFGGTMPNLPGAPGGGSWLPIIFPTPPPSLPLIGTIENRLDAGIRVQGTLALDGEVRLSMVRALAQAKLFSRTVFDRHEDFPHVGRLSANPDDLRRVAVHLGPHTLTRFNHDVPVFRGVVASFWGIVTVNASVSVGISGEVTLSATIRPLVPAAEARLAASVAPRLSVSIWVDILLGVASAGADATTEARLTLAVRLNTEATPPVWLESPCLRIRVMLSAWARVLWRRWNMDPFELVGASFPHGCAALLAQGFDPRQEPVTVDPANVMAAPSVAAGPDGVMLAVHVEGTAPDAPAPEMQLVTRFWQPESGSWGEPIALATGEHVVLDPVAAYVGQAATPMVVWTQNTMTPEQMEAIGEDMVAALPSQEIFYALWNGEGWDIRQLTDDALPDGRAAIMGDATGATLAWVRDTDGDIKTRLDWRIVVTHWDEAKGTWGSIMSFDQPFDDAQVALGMAAQPSVARANGAALVAWTNDADGDLTTPEDRHVAVAQFIGQAVSVRVLDSLPAGVDTPSIAVESSQQCQCGGQLDAAPRATRPQQGCIGRTHLGFVVRDTAQPGGVNVGIGDQGIVWTAHQNPQGGWVGSPLYDGQEPVRGERPLVRTDGQCNAVVVMRRFGPAGTTAELGQLAVTKVSISSGSITPPPLYLTDEARQHWQQAAAYDTETGRLAIVNVSRAGIIAPELDALAAAATLEPASSGARPTVASIHLAASDDPVESLVVEPGADPALDPDLALSQQHAEPGSAVVVTATVRNVGLTPTSGLKVTLYAGSPATGTELGVETIAETLEFNESRAVAFQVTAASGLQPLTALVTTDGANTSTGNDAAEAALGELPPPTNLVTAPSPEGPTAIMLGWVPPAVPGVAGYRILRSGAAGGPYELVGEALGAEYTDLLLERGRTYYYVVQAYDEAGVVSAHSEEVSATVEAAPVAGIYLPVIGR